MHRLRNSTAHSLRCAVTNDTYIRISSQFPTGNGCPLFAYRISFTAMSSTTKADADSASVHPGHEPSTEVYAVHGADPEVQAYGMAKYSRSALSMRESLAEINEQKAEKFLNTFYFQYGHRSIADLAHVAFAIESLSILAATVVVDEPRWDGQERSTRYQDFQKSGYFVPSFGGDTTARALYRKTVDLLFSEYRHFSDEMFNYLRDRTPKPPEMKQEAYERTLRARAFDISRYLLPLAANTSLGQIVSARTLESQVSRLLYQHSHHSYRQIRDVVEALPEVQRRELIELGLQHRGRHDEVARAFCAGQQFRFDILMDIGGFRDMHRHRRCVQIVQGYTAAHGYDMPPEIHSAGLTICYDSVMDTARAAIAKLAAREADEAEEQSQYAIPLAFRKRTLFKMDLSEAIYISELRTGAAGHLSYRNVAYAMYEAVAQRYPSLETYFPVTDVREPVDLLKR